MKSINIPTKRLKTEQFSFFSFLLIITKYSIEIRFLRQTKNPFVLFILQKKKKNKPETMVNVALQIQYLYVQTCSLTYTRSGSMSDAHFRSSNHKDLLYNVTKYHNLEK